MTNSLPATQTDDSKSLTTEQTELCRDTAEKIRKAETIMFKSLFKIGELLIKVKNQLDHGQFGKWRSSELGFTQRTAQNYMNAFRYLGDKSETVSRLPMKTIYDLAALPEDQCDEIVALITDPANPPVAEIKKIVAARKLSKNSTTSQEPIAPEKAVELSEETPAAKEAELPDLMEPNNTLDDQALKWVKKLGLNMTQEIASAVRLSNAELVMTAMLKATDALSAYLEAEDRELRDVMDSLTLAVSEYSIAPDGNVIQELDLTAT